MSDSDVLSRFVARYHARMKKPDIPDDVDAQPDDVKEEER